MSGGNSRSKSRGPSPLVKFYLVAYNALSCIGWSYVLFATVSHLLGHSSTPGHITQTASTTLARIMSSIPWASKYASALPTKNYVATKLPEFLVPVYERMHTTYMVAGPATALVQSLAVLEIFHSLAGLVKSPLATTAVQVYSRLFLVWGIVERFETTHTNPFFASMVFAWSFTEVIRYSFYALALLGKPPAFLLWLRYTTFYVLYPLGASSEAFLIYATLPSSPLGRPNFASLIKGTWLLPDYFRGLMFVVWWPGLFVLMSYMAKQRSKIYGSKRTKVE